MSRWDDLQMDTKIDQILNVQSHDPGHHFGRPFMTPYQIAIEFERQYPNDFPELNKEIGGKGTGERNSVAQYIAQVLSTRIKNNVNYPIEGRFLHRAYLHKLKYKTSDKCIESSLGQSYDLSLFRLKE